MVDYQFYTKSFGGEKIPAETFDRVRRLSEAYLNNFTFGRMDDVIETIAVDKIKYCICEMCDMVYDAKFGNQCKEKKSENIDGYSVTYVTESVDGELTEAVLCKKLYRVAEVYLAGTGLLSFCVD